MQEFPIYREMLNLKPQRYTMEAQDYAPAALHDGAALYDLEYAGAAGARAEREFDTRDSIFFDDSDPLQTPLPTPAPLMRQERSAALLMPGETVVSKAVLHRQFRIIDKEMEKYRQKAESCRVHGDHDKAEVLLKMAQGLEDVKRRILAASE